MRRKLLKKLRSLSPKKLSILAYISEGLSQLDAMERQGAASREEIAEKKESIIQYAREIMGDEAEPFVKRLAKESPSGEGRVRKIYHTPLKRIALISATFFVSAAFITGIAVFANNGGKGILQLFDRPTYTVLQQKEELIPLNGIWAPTRLPPEFELKNNQATKNRNAYIVWYQNLAQENIYYFYNRSKDKASVDNEFTNAEKIEKDGQTVYFFIGEDQQNNVVGVLQDTDNFRLQGYISKEVLLEIAFSIQYINEEE